MDRRSFLAFLSSAAAALVASSELDIERILWVPKPMVSVPDLAIPTLVFHKDAFAFVTRGLYAGDIKDYRGFVWNMQRRYNEAVTAHDDIVVQSRRDLDFYSGVQWPANTQQDRESCGLPRLIGHA